MSGFAVRDARPPCAANRIKNSPTTTASNIDGSRTGFGQHAVAQALATLVTVVVTVENPFNAVALENGHDSAPNHGGHRIILIGPARERGMVEKHDTPVLPASLQ